MLTNLDESLRHQLATTFDHVGSSDHRFFDRYWFGAYDGHGRMQFCCGMGQYANMNVQDGFAAVQLPRTGSGVDQHNFRVTRALRPTLDTTAVGPLSIEILKPYERVRLLWTAGDFPLSFDLEWRAYLPPSEEKHHFTRVNGRPFQDYHRYTQAGRVFGEIAVGERKQVVDDWWGGRDHSWGVRSQVGGYEVVNGVGTEDFLRALGFVFYWLTFNSDEVGGYVQLQYLGNGTAVFSDGELVWRSGRRMQVASGTIEAEFHPGTRIFRHLRTHLVGQDGTTADLEAEPILGYWSMDGTGYDWGWNDGKGLGFYRGDYYSEHDVYDISHPETVIRPDGSVHTPAHREAPSIITVDGRRTPRSVGHQVFVLNGPVPFLGIGE
ncbi:MAG: hypothetical protein U0587_00550 [Candidatus Binatia bacterium]